MSRRRISTSLRSKIINIAVTGYRKIKEPRNVNVFALDVTWNNGEKYEIYRRYSELFSFHTTLKELFQVANERGSDNPIPQFPKLNFFLRNKVARVSGSKLEQFDRYCQAIISLDPSISESSHILAFFSPQTGDRQLLGAFKPAPSSPLPPQGLLQRTNSPSGSKDSQLEEYRALDDFSADDSSQISFRKGDQVFVKKKDVSGWWLCKANGKVGWAPPTYLKKYVDLESSDDSLGYIKVQLPNRQAHHSEDAANGPTKAAASGGCGEADAEMTTEEYRAIDAYEADGPDQVSFKEGDIIHVFEKMEEGWWFVCTGQEEGWAPCSYLERVNGQEEDEEEDVSGSDVEKHHSIDSYEAEEADEISFPKGVIVDVIQKRLNGWWFVKYEDKSGLAPATFLRKGTLPPSKVKSATPENRRRDERENLAYENIRARSAQPPRRDTVRSRVKQKRIGRSQEKLQSAKAKAPKVKLHSYANCQPIPSEREFKSLDIPKAETSIENVHNASFRSEGGSVKRPIATPRNRLPRQRTAIEDEEATGEEQTPKSKLLPLRKTSSYEVPRSVRALSDSPSAVQEPVDEPSVSQEELIEAPPLPPRPTASVYRRAKENTRLECTSSEKSYSANSWSHPQQGKPRQKLKKVKSQTAAEEGRRSISKMKSDSLTATSSRLEVPTDERQPRTMPRSRSEITSQQLTKEEEGASGGGENPFSDEMTAALLKYILASPDPSLKATLKDIISNNEAVQRSLVE